MKFQIIKKAIIFVIRKEKKWFFTSLFISIISGIVPVLMIWITKLIVNQVSLINKSQYNNLKLVFILIFVQFFLMSSSTIITNFKSYIDNKVQITMDYFLKKKIFEKTNQIPYEYFEKHNFYNHLNRISISPGIKFISPIRSLFEFFEATISIISLLMYLLNVSWILVIVAFLSGLPYFFVQYKFGSNKFNLLLRQTPLKREISYIENLLNNKVSNKEIRSFGLFRYFYKRWNGKFSSNTTLYLQLLKKQQIFEIILEILTSLFYLISALIIVWLIVSKGLLVGEFVAIGQAVMGTQKGVNQSSTSLAKILEESLYITDIFEFMDYNKDNYLSDKNKLICPPLLKKCIDIKNLNFKYHDSKEYSLKNINLSIKSGEKIAIVGANGSGKSTLLKCLIGLYKVKKGHIFFDEMEINNINIESLRENITILFQDFLKYYLTAKENIGLGNADQINNEEKIYKVAKLSGIDKVIDKLQKKYNTYLGQYLNDGEDLSGGQWQKLAFSRALFRDSSILILDEPTAALDPISELKAFKQFANITKDKTLILITHKMLAAQIADRIIVMDKGEIVEEGTHQELLNQNKLYAKMFENQMISMEKSCAL